MGQRDPAAKVEFVGALGSALDAFEERPAFTCVSLVDDRSPVPDADEDYGPVIGGPSHFSDPVEAGVEQVAGGLMVLVEDDDVLAVAVGIVGDRGHANRRELDHSGGRW